jgi:CheY-like chemotaxis protein
MGGTIVVKSTPGKGSLFRVEVPVELADTADILQPVAVVHGEVTGLVPGQPNYRILIAEDQRDNQLLLSRLMSDIGLEVQVAENGEQCVKLFQDWHPDLIWMDRRMPVMDGEEAARCIRRLAGGDQVKIVAVTASAFMEEQQEMLDAGMNDFVRKPYRFDEIYDCLARQLGVEYVYRSEAPLEPTPVALTPEMLTVLPAALREALREALESLDGERIAAAVRQIAEIDAALGRTLSRLAEYFDYPAILKALNGTNSQ